MANDFREWQVERSVRKLHETGELDEGVFRWLGDRSSRFTNILRSGMATGALGLSAASSPMHHAAAHGASHGHELPMSVPDEQGMDYRYGGDFHTPSPTPGGRGGPPEPRPSPTLIKKEKNNKRRTPRTLLTPSLRGRRRKRKTVSACRKTSQRSQTLKTPATLE